VGQKYQRGDALKFGIRQYVMPPGFVETRIHL